MEIYEVFFIVSVLIDKEEISLFWKINQRHVKLILELADNDLFTVDRFDMILLIKLNPFEGIYVPGFDQPAFPQGDNRDVSLWRREIKYEN